MAGFLPLKLQDPSARKEKEKMDLSYLPETPDHPLNPVDSVSIRL